MNSVTRQSLLAVAAQRAQSHPADVQGPLAEGQRHYGHHVSAIYAAVVVLATLLLGAGLLINQIADSQHQNTPPPIELPPEDPAPEDPALVRINLDPPTLIMVPGQLLPVQARGTYENGFEEPIPALELSWRVDGGDKELLAPSVASVDLAGNVTAYRPGQAILTASTQGVEESAAIIVTDNPGDPGDPGGFRGPGNLENLNSTPPTTTTPPVG